MNFEQELQMHLLGLTVKDKINGFTGIVTGFCQYLTGCNQALVAPTCGPDGAVRESHWIDVQRLSVVEGIERFTLDNGPTPGFDKAPPKR